MRFRLFSEIRYRLRGHQGRRRKKAPAASSGSFELRPAVPDQAGWDAANRTSLIPTLRSRWELTKLVRPGSIGLELGVAKGAFSELMLRNSNLGFLYSVDMYAEKGHDIDQYRQALVRLDPFRERNTLLKMRFDEALPLFPDGYFDFIYVDGYASEGEEGGSTFYDWFPKLKRGGVFAGHDYDPHWPFVVKAVDKFIAENNLTLFSVGGEADPIDAANQYASWFVLKP